MGKRYPAKFKFQIVLRRIAEIEQLLGDGLRDALDPIC